MMINKFLTLSLLKLEGSQIPSILINLKEREYRSIDSNMKIQEELIKKLLIHCYENVPYYNPSSSDSKLNPYRQTIT